MTKAEPECRSVHSKSEELRKLLSNESYTQAICRMHRQAKLRGGKHLHPTIRQDMKSKQTTKYTREKGSSLGSSRFMAHWHAHTHGRMHTQYTLECS